MDNQADYLACERRVLRGLIETISVSLITNFPTPRVDLDDVEQLVSAVRVLMPDVPEIGLFEGLLLAAKGRWLEAGQVFRFLSDNKQCYPDSKALLGYCLSVVREPEWQVVINEVMEHESAPNALTLARIVVAKNDYRRALEEARNTGVFVLPESARRLNEERAAQAAEAAAEANVAQKDWAAQGTWAAADYLRL